MFSSLNKGVESRLQAPLAVVRGQPLSPCQAHTVDVKKAPLQGPWQSMRACPKALASSFFTPKKAPFYTLGKLILETWEKPYRALAKYPWQSIRGSPKALAKLILQPLESPFFTSYESRISPLLHPLAKSFGEPRKALPAHISTLKTRFFFTVSKSLKTAWESAFQAPFSANTVTVEKILSSDFQLLPTTSNYFQLLPSSTNYFPLYNCYQLLPTTTNYYQLLPTCQHCQALAKHWQALPTLASFRQFPFQTKKKKRAKSNCQTTCKGIAKACGNKLNELILQGIAKGLAKTCRNCNEIAKRFCKWSVWTQKKENLSFCVHCKFVNIERKRKKKRRRLQETGKGLAVYCKGACQRFCNDD